MPDLGSARRVKSARREDEPAWRIARSDGDRRGDPVEKTPFGWAAPGGMMAGMSVLSPVLAAMARQAMR